MSELRSGAGRLPADPPPARVRCSRAPDGCSRVRRVPRAGRRARITTELALAWARLPVDAHPHRWRQRLAVVRGFARYLATIDPASEIPSTDLLPAHRPRIAPYIYSRGGDRGVDAPRPGVDAAAARGASRTLIGLLAVTGCGPARRSDSTAEMSISPRRAARARRASRHKQREVPLHPSTTARCAPTPRQRDRCCPQPALAGVLPQPRGDAAAPRRSSTTTFAQADRPDRTGRSRRAGPPKTARPQAHLGGAHAAGLVPGGEDVDRRMPLLSTFLGHVDPSSTYWYLQAVPELMALVAARLERLPGGAVMTRSHPTLQAFFTERLITQRDSSPQTIAAYRDTFRLLLAFAQRRPASSRASWTSTTSTRR